MDPDKDCPRCGEDGKYFAAPPRLEALHFIERLLWDAHRLRQALEAAGRQVLVRAASEVIRQVDWMAHILLDRDSE